MSTVIVVMFVVGCGVLGYKLTGWLLDRLM